MEYGRMEGGIGCDEQNKITYFSGELKNFILSFINKFSRQDKNLKFVSEMKYF